MERKRRLEKEREGGEKILSSHEAKRFYVNTAYTLPSLPPPASSFPLVLASLPPHLYNMEERGVEKKRTKRHNTLEKSFPPLLLTKQVFPLPNTAEGGGGGGGGMGLRRVRNELRNCFPSPS